MSERLSRRERHAVRTARVSETPTRVLIVGPDHPHNGATGTIARGDIVRTGTGPGMVRVELDSPDLGASSCYCTAAELQPVTFSYGRAES